MSKPEVTAETPPLFSCQNDWCACETSYPADMLHLWEGKPICEGCFEDGSYCSEKRWFELPEFVPAADARIAELEAELAATRKTLERVAPAYRHIPVDETEAS